VKRVGILGGGQLGAMLAEAIHALGAEVRIYDADPDAVAVRRFAGSIVAPWSDVARLREFAEGCSVVTYEVEHVDANALRAAGLATTPSLRVLETAQDRAREKAFLRDGGFPHVGFAEATADDVAARAAAFGFPLVMKATRGGYDGKAQWRVDDAVALSHALAQAHALGCDRFVLEDALELTAEGSCIVARSSDDATVAFPAFENQHTAHVLDWTLVPARLPAGVVQAMERIAVRLARALDVVGLLTVEFFVTSAPSPRSRAEVADGMAVYVNELAPRPHNSGHVTRRACTISQFDALARVLVGAPLVAPSLVAPHAFAMANLLGDAVGPATEHSAFDQSENVLELHLYGKRSAAPRRKMGHVIARGRTPAAAIEAAIAVRARLRDGGRAA